MATITRDLGPVTAYKYAVSKGFTGTEEEFAQLMADLANMSSRIIAVEDDVEQVEGTVNSLDDELAVVETTVTSQGTRISTLEGKMTTAEADISNVKPRVTTLEGTATSLQSQITALTTRRATTITVFGSISAAVHRIGNTVTVAITGTPGISLPEQTSTVVGTLPTGYRPSARGISMLYTSTALGSTGLGKYPQITFNTNGQIEVYNWGGTYTANAGWVRGMYTFVTNDT